MNSLPKDTLKYKIEKPSILYKLKDSTCVLSLYTPKELQPAPAPPANNKNNSLSMSLKKLPKFVSSPSASLPNSSAIKLTILSKTEKFNLSTHHPEFQNSWNYIPQKECSTDLTF